MIDDQRHSLQRCTLLFPTRRCVAPSLEKRFFPIFVVPRIGAVQICHAFAQRSRDPGDIAGVEVDMRVAGGVNIAHRAVEPRRLLEQRDDARRFEIARLPGLDLRIARLRLQQRHPANLELCAGADHQIGASSARDEARARLDAVRILEGRGGGVDRHLVAADFLRQRAPFRLAGQDVERGDRW